MKSQFYLPLLISFLSFTANAQWSFGLKTGSSFFTPQTTNQTFVNRTIPCDEFRLGIQDVSNSIYAGAFGQLDLDAHFFLNFEALYNAKQITYTADYRFEKEGRSADVVTYLERTKQIDLPVSIGVHLGEIDLHSGFVARYILSSQNEMEYIVNYHETMRNVQFGFQTGIGFSIARAYFGLTYQMDFENYGAHLNINGENLDLSNCPSRLIGTVGYRF
jgi:hypothetical protein